MVRVRDGAGRTRAFRIRPGRLLALVLTLGAITTAGGIAVGLAVAPRPDPTLARRLETLERENRGLRDRVDALEEESGIEPVGGAGPPPIPIPELESEPTVAVAVHEGGPSLTIEGEGLTMGGDVTTGAVEVRWTRDGMSTVDGRQVPDGCLFAAGGRVHVHGVGGYPGVLRLYHQGARILVVNEVPLERYVQGVVGSELPASWNIEVKKAQAVAARSYAMARAARQDGPYALRSTTLDQVYRPGAVDAATVEAVEATRGLVLVQDDHLVEAYYHSTCGGHTENGAYVWPDRGITDDWSVVCSTCADAPHFRWEHTLTIEELTSALRREQPGKGLVTALTILGRTPSGRVRTVRLSTETGAVVLQGNDLRRIVGYTAIRSTLFDIEHVDEGLRLVGRGSGHGVGMCQWGAHGMTESGASYGEVLAYYYRGSRPHQAYP